ncbi:TRAP transporter small permease [Echinicola sediminis]
MKQLIEKVLKLGTLASTLGFIGAALIQIYARFFLSSAPSWTEEASRFFFVYAMSFAAGLAMKDNYYVHLDVLYAKMKPQHQRRMDLLISLSIIILFLVMGIFALQYVILGLSERSPSLGVPMAIAFASIVVMSASVGLFAWYKLKSNLKNS